MSNQEQHDLVIVGAGPAGLTAAMLAESQKLDALVIEAADRLGGQAGTATFIENCPGMPEGVTGEEFASRIIDHALKFETEFIAPSRAVGVARVENGIEVTTDEHEKFIGSAVLLAFGGEHRRLRARNLAAYLGRGAAYKAPADVDDYSGKNIGIVGGSDSAGQSAAQLADAGATQVNLFTRGSSLAGRMSGTLVEKIAERENIQVHTNCQLVGVDGSGCLETATIQSGDQTQTLPIDNLFILIGSKPRTEWLPESVEKDHAGFIVSGFDIPLATRESFLEETDGREPFPHETSMPKLFVAGDVRHGNQGWVSIAMFDGAAVIPEIHRLRVHEDLKGK